MYYYYFLCPSICILVLYILGNIVKRLFITSVTKVDGLDIIPKIKATEARDV